MVETKQQILDIAMNLTRIGNWAADGYDEKQKRIRTFLDQTSDYVKDVRNKEFPSEFKPTFETFYPEFLSLYEEALSKPNDTMTWAEKMMTWGTILTHRASLFESA